MSSTMFSAVILLVCALTFGAAQTSCKGRCGAEYYRGYTCQCDYNCLSYNECCKDYEAQCTTKNSCKGRCGESFRRGRMCSCDSDCVKYKQCCSDYKDYCEADVITTEEIIGAASATAPAPTNSCNNVNDNKPKEPTLNTATEQTSTFSEGNNADDHLIPLVSPTSYQQDDPSNGMFTQEDPEGSPIPESTSGYGSSTADLLDPISMDPTQDPDALESSTETVTVLSQTQTTLSDNEPTHADDNPSTLYPTIEEASTGSTDASDPTNSSNPGTPPPLPTTAGVSSQPTPTSVPQTDYPGTTNTPELEMVEETEAAPINAISPEAQTTDLTVASSDEPEVTTLPFSTASDQTVAPVSTQGPSTAQDSPHIATTPSMLDAISEATTSNLGDDTGTTAGDVTTSSSPADLDDPSISVSPAGPGSVSDALTTHTPASTDAVQEDTTEDVTPGRTTADPLNVTPTKPTPSETTSKPQDKPLLAKPSSKPETKPLDQAQPLSVDDPRDYQADDSNDTNLCSGRPVGAVTTLRNGTIVVFRGHFFWFLDRNRVPGPARDITQVWGVPSPIDTAFTRCNCQGKTYIFRGSQYWRFENDVLDPGYPKVIETGFDGLRGHITAALSVPQYQRRRESVYFFKRGGSVQRYSYQFGTSPTCGRKPQFAIYTVRHRFVRQTVSLLGPAINIRTSWRGFPSTVTAAVSIPSNIEPEGYKYYVFSKSKSYNVRMDGDRPLIAAAAPASPQSNDLFTCPKKV